MHTYFIYLLACLFVLAGVYHFINPRFYIKIMPAYLPWHKELVLVSGALEIIFGILLLPLATRTEASWALMLLLIAVFPANIEMARKFAQKKHPYYWLTLLRLPLQVLLIWWVWKAGGTV